MFCNNCGNQIPDNSVNCPNCGAPTGAGGTQVPLGTPAAKVPFAQQTDTGINFIALIIAVVGLVCVFLSKVTAKVTVFGFTQKESASILSKYGWLMLALFIITAVLLFLKKSHSAVVPAAINAIFCVFKMIQELNSVNDADLKSQLEMLGSSADVSVTLNFFFWIVILTSILEVVAILILPKVMGKK